ncbi:hypothetical protein Bhyg_15230 [Pseudolycoriella hygida]|uniref:Condensin complex subunit 2 n=1 Tax=Pseudolycoriella hygida TaxID=35572 RepID=A0A9Q0MS52_9DIPT|nr:hypothetical protein Bhyg_15230 [Pseudolycoriella hygida]
MVQRHHKALGSFQQVGSMLEASSKIYGMRVDSLHDDVFHLHSGLNRQNVMENANENVAEYSIPTFLGEKSQDTTKRRKPTIVTNKDAINAPLETKEEIRSVASQSFSLNSLPSVNYCMTLGQKGKLFADLEMEDQACGSVDLPELNWFPSARDVIRPKLTGYVISNSSADRNRSETGAVEFRFDLDGESDTVIEESNSFRCDDFRPITNEMTNEITEPKKKKRKVVVADKPVDLLLLSENIDENFLSTNDPQVGRIKKANMLKWQASALKQPSVKQLAPNLMEHRENYAEENAVSGVDTGANATEEIVDLPDEGRDFDSNEEHTSDVENVVFVQEIQDMLDLPNIAEDDSLKISPADINIEQLSKKCFEIIRNIDDRNENPTFSQVCHELRVDNIILTPAVIFSSILLLAEKHALKLSKIGESNDFVISRWNEEL